MVPLVSWQVGSVPVKMVMSVGVPTTGVTTTLRETIADGPLQPLAVTWISTEPANPLAQVISPVAGLMVPAAGLLSDQLKPVLSVDVVA